MLFGGSVLEKDDFSHYLVCGVEGAVEQLFFFCFVFFTTDLYIVKLTATESETLVQILARPTIQHVADNFKFITHLLLSIDRRCCCFLQ